MYLFRLQTYTLFSSCLCRAIYLVCDFIYTEQDYTSKGVLYFVCDFIYTEQDYTCKGVLPYSEEDVQVPPIKCKTESALYIKCMTGSALFILYY